MDEVAFEREATGQDYTSLEDVFSSPVFDSEREQEYTQYRLLYNVKTVRRPHKCTNPICDSFDFIQRDVQTGRADEAATTFYQCLTCGRLHR